MGLETEQLTLDTTNAPAAGEPVAAASGTESNHVSEETAPVTPIS